ncbi:MAG: SAM-dependent chlorinase/fluorinase [Planctomycetes bacterium]|nr:SAM-dependent chlorinase/fluorinase [Planctomycetota bacterium]
MRAPLLALLSDFGHVDPYVGVMKAVVLARCPDLPIVDLTHEVPPQDLRWGAFLLRGALPYLPTGSVVLAIVDPGVGGARRLLCAEAEGRLLLGPDNGLLPAALAGCAARWTALDPARGFGLGRPSATFHGRDLFAPAAARLAAGVSVRELGDEIADPVRVEAPSDGGPGTKNAGRIAVVDRYGNLISDLAPGDDGWEARDAVLELAGRWTLRPVRTYSDVASGELLAYVGSYGTYEIAVRDGSAAERLQLGAGASLVLRRGES